jgi:hypothetical protein
MQGKNFLADFLMNKPQQQQPQQPQQAAPVVEDENKMLISALQAAPKKTAGLISLPELANRETLAKTLLTQANDRNAHPLARGLAAYFGSKELQDIGAERGKTEQAIKAAEEEKEKLKQAEDTRRFEAEFGLKEKNLDLQKQGLQQDAAQFEKKLGLERAKFNLEAARNAQGEAVTKVPSADGKIDLLFKGNAPLNDGLEKGLQWGVDDKGNRIAVPIATMPNEKASQTKELTLNIVNRLLKNEDGVRAIYGVGSELTPNLFDSTREAETDIKQLTDLLTVENLDLIKGVISDTDMGVLRSVGGGGLAKTTTEEGAIRALKDVQKSLIGGKKEDEKDTKQNVVSGFKFLGVE